MAFFLVVVMFVWHAMLDHRYHGPVDGSDGDGRGDHNFSHVSS